MKKPSLKGLKVFTDQSGRARCYHRRTGHAFDLNEMPIGSPAFLAKYDELEGFIAPAPKPRTLGELMKAYLGSAAFLRLAPRTQSNYRQSFKNVEQLYPCRLDDFDRPSIAKVRDKLAERGHERANYALAVMSTLMSWGVEQGYLLDNPVRGVRKIRRPRELAQPNRPWTDLECHLVLESAPPHLRLPLEIMMNTGMGPTDALSLKKAAYHDGCLTTQRAKTGKEVHWPLPPHLVEIIEQLPPSTVPTLCTTSRGTSWTTHGFKACWNRLRQRVEQDGLVGEKLTLYGLRHRVAVIMREMGMPDRAIADALGHETTAMVRRYARGADLRARMNEIAPQLHGELNKRRTALSNTAVKVDKKATC